MRNDINVNKARSATAMQIYVYFNKTNTTRKYI